MASFACLLSGSATAGSDFSQAVGKVSFAANQAIATVKISISNDSTPEENEFFTVVLFNASTNSVVASPTSASVVILKNDDANGVVSFRASSTVTIDEDTRRTATYTVIRAQGTFGSISVFWQVS